MGDKVEIELWDRPLDTVSDPSIQNFPRGTMLYGTLSDIAKPDKPKLADDASEKEIEDADIKWKEQWVYQVDVAKEKEDGSIDWDGETTSQLSPMTRGLRKQNRTRSGPTQ